MKRLGIRASGEGRRAFYCAAAAPIASAIGKKPKKTKIYRYAAWVLADAFPVFNQVAPPPRA